MRDLVRYGMIESHSVVIEKLRQNSHLLSSLSVASHCQLIAHACTEKKVDWAAKPKTKIIIKSKVAETKMVY